MLPHVIILGLWGWLIIVSEDNSSGGLHSTMTKQEFSLFVSSQNHPKEQGSLQKNTFPSTKIPWSTGIEHDALKGAGRTVSCSLHPASQALVTQCWERWPQWGKEYNEHLLYFSVDSGITCPSQIYIIKRHLHSGNHCSATHHSSIWGSPKACG